VRRSPDRRTQESKRRQFRNLDGSKLLPMGHGRS
jgi:hypothetical protein